MKALLVFRARSQATKFYDKIKHYDCTAKLTSTPSSAYRECSLSVLTTMDALVYANGVIACEKLNTFIGAFVSVDGWKTAQKVRI